MSQPAAELTRNHGTTGKSCDDELHRLLEEALDLNIAITFNCKYDNLNDAQPGTDIEKIMRYSTAASHLIKGAMEQLARKEPMSQQQREEPSTQDGEMEIVSEGVEEIPLELLEEWETQEESYVYYMMMRVRITLQLSRPSVTPH